MIRIANEQKFLGGFRSKSDRVQKLMHRIREFARSNLF